MNPEQETNQAPTPTPPEAPVVTPGAQQPNNTSAGNGLSVAGFVVAISSVGLNFFTFGITSVVGLVLSIVGRIQSKRAGHPNGLALAGIIISAIVSVITMIVFAVIIYTGISMAAKCNELGQGVHTISGTTTITCGPDGSYNAN